MREITATVLENKRIADEIYSLTFALDEELKVRPGQFVMLGVGGFPLRRPIAVCKAEGSASRCAIGSREAARGRWRAIIAWAKSFPS